MLLTVAICTRDRPESLRRTLTSLAQADAPGGASWEVLVVDNGTSNDTATVVQSFQGLPLRIIREARPGLARTRNAAVAGAKGDYIVWTDDDCVVDPQWLAAYADAFRTRPNAALFGGPIIPHFEGHAPVWLRRAAARVGHAYAARDLGPDPFALSLTNNRVPYGANYAIRTREQRGRPYDENLGRGTALPMSVGEESEVLEGLLRDGAEGWWIPRARVTHCIPPERQTIAYLRDYYTAYGAYEEWRNHMGRGSNEPLPVAWRAELRYQLLRRLASHEHWIDALIIASMARGRARARRWLPRSP